jgi:Insertion element 4 transposase N-terminal
MAPAAPTLLGSPPPITDRIALGALTRTFPPELVDQVIQQTGRAEQRRRLLPARVVVYFVLALALYGQVAYEEVMRCLVEGLGWARQARRGRRSWPYWHVPGASALVEARTRLGLSRWGCCLLSLDPPKHRDLDGISAGQRAI